MHMCWAMADETTRREMWLKIATEWVRANEACSERALHPTYRQHQLHVDALYTRPLHAAHVEFLANVNSRSLYVVDRPSVCRLSVTFVRPTQAIEIFGDVSTPFDMLAIYDLCIKILRRSSQGNSSVGRVKQKRGSRIYRFWTSRRLYLRNGAK